MRLLERKYNGNFSLTKDFGDDIPRYAILARICGADSEEVTLDGLVDGTGAGKAGHQMIRFCGEQATRDGFQYVWVDTRCIDKSNSVEVRQAVNSILHRYKNSDKCYVYLPDVSTRQGKSGDWFSEYTWDPAFRSRNWFTRGWSTLQELLAPDPDLVEFFSQEGDYLGDMRTLEQQIHEITGIAISALRRDSQTSIHGKGKDQASKQPRGETDRPSNSKRIDGLPLATDALFHPSEYQAKLSCLPETRGNFIHDPLDLSVQQIRLVRIQKSPQKRGSSQPVISLSISHHDIKDCPLYTALSYTWGPQNLTRLIAIEGQTFVVRENLWHFLGQAASLKLRGYLWIDQICIAQDNLEEKNHQVKFMSTIFSSSSLVIAWLGLADQASNEAITMIRCGQIDLWKRENTIAFLNRPYWRRLWIIQELSLAPEIEFLCGSQKFTWEMLANVHGEAPMAEGASFRVWFMRPIVAQKYSMGRSNLEAVLRRFHEDGQWECENPLDSIYGLMGLVSNEYSIDVNYASSREQVFWDVIVRIVPRWKARIENDFIGIVTERDRPIHMAQMVSTALRISIPQDFYTYNFRT